MRPIEVADVEVCGSIMRALPAWFGIEEAIRRYEATLGLLDGFVACHKDRIVGFVGLKRCGAKVVEIDVIAVHPDYRRNGIGTLLLSEVEASAVTRETRLLHTKTIGPSSGNAAYAESRAFWRAAGFIPMDEHELWGPENPCLVLVKVLS